MILDGIEHRRDIDVQYILSGQEVIHWAPTEELLPAGEYSEENDTMFFEAEGRARLHLTPGTFALFYPEDAHKPNCARDEPERVRKVVVKVQVG
jgi:YhcH/YjgK/YiaL family protein